LLCSYTTFLVYIIIGDVYFWWNNLLFIYRSKLSQNKVKISMMICLPIRFFFLCTSSSSVEVPIETCTCTPSDQFSLIRWGQFSFWLQGLLWTPMTTPSGRIIKEPRKEKERERKLLPSIMATMLDLLTHALHSDEFKGYYLHGTLYLNWMPQPWGQQPDDHLSWF
jgi:hypothetical protein